MAIWQVHSGEPQLIKQVFVHLLDTLFHCVAYQEKMKGNKPVRIETPVPKAVRLSSQCCLLYPNKISFDCHRLLKRLLSFVKWKRFNLLLLNCFQNS